LTNQKGVFVTFNTFVEDYLSKFDDEENSEPRDIVNVLSQQEIPAQLQKDIWEPDAVKVALDHEYTTFNMFS
jgi:hypothetical protein